MNFTRLRLGIGLAVLIGFATAAAGLAQTAPPGSNPNAASPQASPTGGPTRGKRAPSSSSSAAPEPSDTPEPPQFTTLDGIWEVEIQPVGKKLANYTHMSITTTGANLSGYYQPGKNKNVKYPLTGTFDGRLISVTATLPNGTTTTLSGYVEAFGDMVGMIKSGDKDPGTAFTAEHRKKQKA